MLLLFFGKLLGLVVELAALAVGGLIFHGARTTGGRLEILPYW